MAREQAKKKETGNTIAAFTSKAMNNLAQTWLEVKGTARTVMGGQAVRPHLPDEDVILVRKQLRACLEPKGGEVTARSNAVELGKTYLQLNSEGRIRFFQLLAEHYDVDHDAVQKKAQALALLSTPEERRKLERELRLALEAPRTQLFRILNSLPDGFKFLVDMRSEMLKSTKTQPQLAPVEDDLKEVLSDWFDIGLLDLEAISWRSPAELLEKLIAYEAVHAIRSWDDLKNRLDADRRVYGFFHHKMPLEPLIFVQVAFTKGLANNIQDVLDVTKPVLDVQAADTAIFYSISNAQRGLAGISFGNFLIKRVVGKLSSEFKQLKNFATLSPVPGFMDWLKKTLAEGKDEALFLPAEIRELTEGKADKTASATLAEILAGDTWADDEETCERIRPVLLRLAARYLVVEKGGRGKRALDPVAHFHLSNGAQLEQIHFLADRSPKGFKQSAGIMVNYNYKLSDIDDNHEEYITETVVAHSRAVAQLLKG